MARSYKWKERTNPPSPPSFTLPSPFTRDKVKTEGQKRHENRSAELKKSIEGKAREYQTNPNQMKGESDASYKVRYDRFKENRKRKLTPLRRKTEELQEKREKLPYLKKMAAEIAMSPLDVAESLTDKMDVRDTEKYKSSKDKRQDMINLGDSALDAMLFAGGGASGQVIAKNIIKTLFKKYGKKARKEVLWEEGFNQASKLNQSLKR